VPQAIGLLPDSRQREEFVDCFLEGLCPDMRRLTGHLGGRGFTHPAAEQFVAASQVHARAEGLGIGLRDDEPFIPSSIPSAISPAALVEISRSPHAEKPRGCSYRFRRGRTGRREATSMRPRRSSTVPGESHPAKGESNSH
jgi:hypothetical protein